LRYLENFVPVLLKSTEEEALQKIHYHSGVVSNQIFLSDRRPEKVANFKMVGQNNIPSRASPTPSLPPSSLAPTWEF